MFTFSPPLNIKLPVLAFPNKHLGNLNHLWPSKKKDLVHVRNFFCQTIVRRRFFCREEQRIESIYTYLDID